MNSDESGIEESFYYLADEKLEISCCTRSLKALLLKKALLLLVLT